ncbi:YjbH domain-containing protein [Sulfitobacter sp. F26204]|uniref:YjbH domain-containing protein n=1 Tax=Sulfitobacter sp. F26204 TaxID=2996014 RepID=UPI00225DD248|nr:YjbH domain-containing protein [Sulfitobacter sp. F26204]MCX7561621.1 YjbH domain-containing protein [Sulfitobacter sp. F26204]
MRRHTSAFFIFAFGTASALALTNASAQSDRTTLSTYGTPGLIETPTARSLNDGELAFTSSLVGPTMRNTVTFQILPGVSGSFRYTRIDGGQADGSANFDRSFDISFQLLDETDLRPAVALGLRDFLGTGLYSGEYLVATKQIGSKLEVTGGIGWGRFAGRDSFTNPLGIIDDRFETRPTGTGGRGGKVEAGEWFRGPASIFGGLAYHLNDQTTLFAEYSTDTYDRESNQGLIDISSPLNVGVQYRFKNGVDLKAFVVGGNEIGAQVTYVLDPAKRANPGGRETAPRPIGSRRDLALADWNNSARGGGKDAAQKVLDARLAEDGLILQGFELSRTRATVRIENTRFGAGAQAAGRAARAMATTLPPDVEELTVIFQNKGVPISRIVTKRSDLEDLQYDYDGSWRSYSRASIEDAFDADRSGEVVDLYPVFDYGLSPYASFSYFDPDEPVRVEAGAQFKAFYRPMPGLTFAGQLRYPLAGNVEDSDRVSDSLIEPVRTNAVRYARESDLEINKLTAEYQFRPGKDLFGRVTAGYLENMFGGVSAELLWYPTGSRLALGAEINYAKQRDFDMLFGFQDYDVVTGHASAYYDFGNGFLGQIDAGRYLAGDWGATVALDREFNNGFRVGAFFTLTDVSSTDFGEGSFDKGIRFEVPLSFLTGKPSKTILNQTIRPVQRDGGARLNVDNRLHRQVRDARGKELRDGWGRYLR